MNNISYYLLLCANVALFIYCIAVHERLNGLNDYIKELRNLLLKTTDYTMELMEKYNQIVDIINKENNNELD